MNRLLTPILVILVLLALNIFYYYKTWQATMIAQDLSIQSTQQTTDANPILGNDSTIQKQDTVSIKIKSNLKLEAYFRDQGLEYFSDSLNYSLVALGYADAQNEFNENFYDGLNKCFLRKEAVEKLQAACKLLKEKHPEYRLLIYDCARPQSVQEKMYEKVKGTPQQSYVASPKTVSLHSLGLAVDVTLISSSTEQELDMGSAIDDLSILSDPSYEEHFLKLGRLSKKQVQNRNILLEIMEETGWKRLSTEWWHFNALQSSEAKKKYKPIL